MNLLDFGSGRPERTLDFWTIGHGIEVLQKITGRRVEALTIHAFDPLEIVQPNRKHRVGVEFHFHTSLETIPDTFDIVCALHPNPIVATSDVGRIGNWEFHHKRYTPILLHVLSEKLSSNGLCILQFDDEWRSLHGDEGIRDYVGYLIKHAGRHESQLHEVALSETDAKFFNISYSFDSIVMLEKVSKNLQKNLLIL